ncbi:hypothetical protein [Rossellomorea aquimaris]|jgi:hypothetical protein|uniref:hypothetical protein n=1 Tax=Rossellomorea aquimaris TaxID=189382 RepID=UPI0024957187|nr:hypothetical protein [Rossellomorea aquimaris]
MKKLLWAILTFGLLFSLVSLNEVHATNVQNVNDIKFSVQDTENLKSLGFTNEELIQMTEEEYLANKDIKGEIVDTETKYIKTIIYGDTLDEQSIDSHKRFLDTPGNTVTIELDEDTFNQELKAEENPIKTLDTTNTEYKKFTTTISKISSTKYRLKNTLTWKKMPSTREWDVSGVGINETYWAPVPNSQYGKQNWTKHSTCFGYEYGSATYNTSSSYWKKGSGGYAHKMNLPNNDFGGGCGHKSVTALSSYMYYDVSRQQSTRQIDAYGRYSHQTSSLSTSVSFSITGPSLSISPSNRFDGPISTHAQVKW